MPKSLENTPESLSLDDLKLRPGDRLRVESRSPRSRFASELIGYRRGASVLISAPRAGALAGRIVEGAQVTVRLMAGNRIGAFSTRLSHITTTPYGCWHLEYPATVEVRRIRASARVPVRLQVAVDSQDDDSPLHGTPPCPGLCTDISLQGACIETSRPVGQPGDPLFLTLRMAVAGIDQVLLVPAIVRNLGSEQVAGTRIFRQGSSFRNSRRTGA
ncbi:flagellar brake protein [Marinobacterium aestuariivivens]|uniref:Flagellar brake protein n=1 Tax=Marinobacterium aestuariivivens TaxID=1698799 RepID=A0ABW1ZU66_9GAMM